MNLLERKFEEKEQNKLQESSGHIIFEVDYGATNDDLYYFMRLENAIDFLTSRGFNPGGPLGKTDDWEEDYKNVSQGKGNWRLRFNKPKSSAKTFFKGTENRGGVDSYISYFRTED